MTTQVKYNEVLCIGLGLAGIGLAVRLKKKYGLEDMHFYDRNESHSGTWYSNRYPGAACDVPAALYSFSFELNAGWTETLPKHHEIHEYINGVVEKYKLRRYMTFRSECESAHWDSERHIWRVNVRNLDSGEVFVHECRVLFSAVGHLSTPFYPKFPGMDSFKGDLLHTARWREDVDLTGKNVVVIGNGCTASQVVPQLVNKLKVKTVTQIIRTSQWLVPYPNPDRSPRELWYLTHIPFLNLLLRYFVFLFAEYSWPLFYMNAFGAWYRKGVEKASREYVFRTAPKKYHDILIPSYPIGCKRRVFDANTQYCKSLNAPNLHLTKSTIVEIGPDGVRTTDNFYPADVIILATGFETNKGLGRLRVQGRDGEWLTDHWAKMGGLSAYNSTCVNGFPNFFMFYGPNANTGHTSVLLALENTAIYALDILKPVLKGKAVEAEVKKEPYEKYTQAVQKASKQRVFFSCKNWYVTDKGWNGSNYPWSQVYFWWRSTFPTRSHWRYT